MRAEPVSAVRSRLGECPVWCERTRRLWWVDVLAPALWSFDPAGGACRSHRVGARRLGSIALRRGGGLLLACDDGIHAYDPDSGRQTFLVDPEPGVAGHRKNDGRADPYGNFWVGTLREADYAKVGALYRIAPDLSVSQQAQGLAIPNSIAFDARRRRLYYADTRAYAIWACDQDPATGDISARRTFATTIPPARPDGSCIDAEGCLWNAEYAGGRIVRYAPSGEVLRSIALPVSHPTCCCFGGPGLDRLFVTTASEALAPQERAAEPLAGLTLALDVGARGRPEYRAAL